MKKRNLLLTIASSSLLLSSVIAHAENHSASNSNDEQQHKQSMDAASSMESDQVTSSDQTSMDNEQDLLVSHSNPLSKLTLDEIEGKEVVNAKGEEIGEVDELVVDRNNNKLMGIISVGGLAGIGDKDIPVDLSNAKINEDDKIVIDIATSEEELENRDEYDDENKQYVRIRGFEKRLGELKNSDVVRLEQEHME